MLNFCDFSRFAPYRKAVRTATSSGLPVNFLAFSVVSVGGHCRNVPGVRGGIYDPVEIVGRIETSGRSCSAPSPSRSQPGINVVANFVSPAYDLANVWPSRIDSSAAA